VAQSHIINDPIGNAMSSDFQPYVKDIRWLFVHCKQAGIKPPEGAHCEAFAERVAIMLADGEMTEAEARECAFAGYLSQR
jgi:hypothetical protein